jgi:hypothetical protein
MRETSSLRVPGDASFMKSCCVAAAIVLGQAVFLGRPPQSGELRFPAGALVLVVIAIAICSIGICLRAGPRLQRISARLLHPLLAIGLVMAIWRLPIIGLFIEFPAGRAMLMPFVLMAALAVILMGILFIARSSAIITICFLLLVTFQGLMGVWYLGISRDPHVDAYVVNRDCAQALAQGKNPYSITFPDIYGPSSGYYQEGLVVNGQVQLGYTYPPLPLLLSMPGYLMGDVRYSQLLAISLAALLVGFSRPGRTAKLAGALILFTPDVFHQLENAWTEPFVLLMLCAVVFLASRRWWMPAGVALGLFLVSKQYAPLAAAAGLLLVPYSLRSARAWRWIVVAIVTGTIITLPFILWDPHAFFHSVGGAYIGELRMDSISIPPLIRRISGYRATLIAPMVAAALASALVLWRGRYDASGFAIGATLILLCVFVFSGHTFANYYFFAAGALCAATAAGERYEAAM